MSILRRIAVLAEPAERGLTIIEFLTNSTTSGVVCTSSDELSRVVNDGKTDAIVIDHQLSGFMTGLDIMQRLARDLVRPVAVLVGDLNPEEREQASRLKINALLPQSATPQAIADAALGALTQEIHGGLSIPHGARMLVRDSDCVAPLPQLLVRLSEFLGNPNATIGELAKEILSDAQITAELLKIVNNAAMGLSGKCTKVEAAVKLIGIKRTVALVLSRHLLGNQSRRAKPLPADMEQKLRQRSVLTASTAATYARMVGSSAADTAYVLGLLQDLGILVQLHQLGNRYFHSLERSSSISQLQLAAIERQEFGFTHADVSAALLQKWEMSPRLIRLVLQHHHPIELVQGSETEVELVRAMQVGEAFADCREQTNSHRRIFLNRLVSKFGQMDVSTLRICLAQSVEKTLEMSQVFGVPIPPGEEFQQLITRLADEIDFQLPEEQSIPTQIEAATASPKPTSDRLNPEDEVRSASSQTESLPLLEIPQEHPADAQRLSHPTAPYLVVIDDEPVIVRLITRMLSSHGIQIVSCTDVATLSELARDALVILCDVHLGRESGIDYIRWLRDLEITTPVIMISGDRRRSTVVESMDVGVAAYLPKPFDQQTLLKKLEPYLDRTGDFVTRVRLDGAAQPAVASLPNS